MNKPTDDIETQSYVYEDYPPAAERRRSSIFRIVFKTVLIICLIPLLLVQIYRFVDPISTLMLGRYLTGQSVAREWRDIDKISDRLKASIIMSEDGQFCTHNGIDWDSLELVVEKFIEGERVRGASTITMQVAKNLFLWNSRSFIRKGLEIPLALYIDMSLSKKRIFEIYLNIAELGPDGVFGVEAASKYHYKKDSDAMTRRQAALLATTLPNPHLRNPNKPSRRMNGHARIIQSRAGRASPWIDCIKDPAN